MYSIGTVIYGVPIDKKLDKALEKLGYDDPEVLGFVVLYSGVAEHTVGYIGVALSEFNVIDDMRIDVDALELVTGKDRLSFDPTMNQISDAEALINALPDKVKKILRPPAVHLIWSTS